MTPAMVIDAGAREQLANGPTARDLADQLHIPVRGIVVALNAARDAGLVARTVEGDPVGPARWWPA